MMYETIILWIKSLSMEQQFILTGICILVSTVPLAILCERFFRKENERNEKDGNQRI